MMVDRDMLGRDEVAQKATLIQRSERAKMWHIDGGLTNDRVWQALKLMK